MLLHYQLHSMMSLQKQLKVMLNSQALNLQTFRISGTIKKSQKELIHNVKFEYLNHS